MRGRAYLFTAAASSVLAGGLRFWGDGEVFPAVRHERNLTLSGWFYDIKSKFEFEIKRVPLAGYAGGGIFLFADIQYVASDCIK